MGGVEGEMGMEAQARLATDTWGRQEHPQGRRPATERARPPQCRKERGEPHEYRGQVEKDGAAGEV